MKRVQGMVQSAALPANKSSNLMLGVAALALAMMAAPHFAHAQGLVGGMRDGARQGTYDGERTAGPVGGVVGGAIGAGVGGAVGAVDGALGVGPRCSGYRDRNGVFHCYH